MYLQLAIICTVFLVNSHSYYKFQVEIGAVTNRDFYIEIVYKAFAKPFYCPSFLLHSYTLHIYIYAMDIIQKFSIYFLWSMILLFLYSACTDKLLSHVRTYILYSHYHREGC